MYSLPELPYQYTDLEPVIDAQTMEIHHSKHHQGYVDKLNAALQSHEDLFEKSVEELVASVNELPDDVRSAVQKFGGGHVNHSLFWSVLSPEKQDGPSGELAAAIEAKFGSVEDFKTEFASTAGSQFGSGWGWLVVNQAGELEILSTPNQDSPLMMGKTPIFGVDVWEHAYYLHYQNRRADYLGKIWDVVNWEQVAELFQNASA